MKVKKNTILLAGGFSFATFLVYCFLQFRIYHWFNLYSNGNEWLTNLREACMVASSGLFTSSCVTLIIGIREYFDTRWFALRDLRRLLCNIEEKFRAVAWYNPKMSPQVLREYFELKYNVNGQSWEEYAEECTKAHIELSSDILKGVEEERATKRAFREHVWNSTPDYKKIHCSTKEDKEIFIDKIIPFYEKEIEDSVKKYIESLQVFRYYDLYQLQAAADSLDFLFDSKKKKALRVLGQDYLVIYINIIKQELQRLENKPDDKMQIFNSMIIINTFLLQVNGDHSEAYSFVEFELAMAKRYITSILTNNPKTKMPELKNFNIERISKPDNSLEIIFDK